MKTKQVTLYADLYPGWHERTYSNLYLSAQTNPVGLPVGSYLRVKITVDLPEHPQPLPADFETTGKVIP